MPQIKQNLDDSVARHGAEAVAAVLLETRAHRVDVCCFGDSTTGFNTIYLSLALRSISMPYATPLYSWGGGEGGDGVSMVTGLPIVGAPAQLAAYLDKGTGDWTPKNYGFGSESVFGANTMVLAAGSPLDVTANLTGRFTYGTFPAGTHNFFPSAHLQAPYALIVHSGDYLSATTGAYGITNYDLVIATDAGRAGREMNVRPNLFGLAGYTDMFLLYGRVINNDRPAGYSVHCFDQQSGQSLRINAYNAQQLSDLTLTTYFSEIRNAQGDSKRIVFWYGGGQNDAADATLSVGRNPKPSNTAKGFYDNFVAFYERIVQLWDLNGWNRRELYWVLSITHPRDDYDTEFIYSLREAARALTFAIPQAAVADVALWTTFAESVTAGWVDGGDPIHPTPLGYEKLQALRLKAALGAPHYVSP